MRAHRVGIRIEGTATCPRLAVYRSNRAISAQLIDDAKHHTIVSASSRDIKTKGNKTAVAALVGELVAKKAVEMSVSSAVFDRRSYRYHGRVKALADGARKGGLKF